MDGTPVNYTSTDKSTRVLYTSTTPVVSSVVTPNLYSPSPPLTVGNQSIQSNHSYTMDGQPHSSQAAISIPPSSSEVPLPVLYPSQSFSRSCCPRCASIYHSFKHLSRTRRIWALLLLFSSALSFFFLQDVLGWANFCTGLFLFATSSYWVLLAKGFHRGLGLTQLMVWVPCANYNIMRLSGVQKTHTIEEGSTLWYYAIFQTCLITLACLLSVYDVVTWLKGGRALWGLTSESKRHLWSSSILERENMENEPSQSESNSQSFITQTTNQSQTQQTQTHQPYQHRKTSMGRNEGNPQNNNYYESTDQPYHLLRDSDELIHKKNTSNNNNNNNHPSSSLASSSSFSSSSSSSSSVAVGAGALPSNTSTSSTTSNVSTSTVSGHKPYGSMQTTSSAHDHHDTSSSGTTTTTTTASHETLHRSRLSSRANLDEHVRASTEELLSQAAQQQNMSERNTQEHIKKWRLSMSMINQTALQPAVPNTQHNGHPVVSPTQTTTAINSTSNNYPNTHSASK